MFHTIGRVVYPEKSPQFAKINSDKNILFSSFH